MLYDLAIVGDGVFAALCALRMADMPEQGRIICATRDRELAGNCTELLLPDLLEPATRSFISDYVVMEWGRYVVAGPLGSRSRHQAIWMLDPVQIFFEFRERCSAAKVLTGVRSVHAIDGYLIVDGDIIPCKNHLDLSSACLSNTHESIVDGRTYGAPDCPILADWTGEKAMQIIPLDEDRAIVNRLASRPVLDSSGEIDIASTFKIHDALNSLMP